MDLRVCPPDAASVWELGGHDYHDFTSYLRSRPVCQSADPPTICASKNQEEFTRQGGLIVVQGWEFWRTTCIEALATALAATAWAFVRWRATRRARTAKVATATAALSSAAIAAVLMGWPLVSYGIAIA